MSSINDGGPAFPIVGKFNGMSIRDYFAAAALQGLLISSPDADCGMKGYVMDAYQYADAMLKAREVKP